MTSVKGLQRWLARLILARAAVNLARRTQTSHLTRPSHPDRGAMTSVTEIEPSPTFAR